MVKKLHLYLENDSLTNQGMNTGTNIVHTSTLAVGVEESRLVYGKSLPLGKKTVVILFNGKSGQDISNVVAVLYDPKFDLAGRLYSISGIKIINDDKITVNQKEALKSMVGKQEPKTTSYHVVMEDSYGDEWGFVKSFGLIIPTEADKSEYYTFDTKEEAEKYLIPGAYLEEV